MLLPVWKQKIIHDIREREIERKVKLCTKENHNISNINNQFAGLIKLRLEKIKKFQNCIFILKPKSITIRIPSFLQTDVTPPRTNAKIGIGRGRGSKNLVRVNRHKKKNK